ncbi:hypothetical protein PFNF135_05422 [Plasmodium falciparum NF135/5.C10]|uniref:Uncharacterized protein n=1 Tax=Plasmodium falciparum NF135/5.C10 TaxID=1036726 RepID=W4IAX9_PLAFA|nr:hypothetical protein PFNF135_05422 [Plasmodium falciparum NF135/5.C10]
MLLTFFIVKSNENGSKKNKTKNSISNINVIWKIISKKNHIIYQYCNELYNNHIYFLKLRRTRNNA